jgi:outer membrane immunogenic protein
MFKSVFAATLALAAVPAFAQDAPQNFNGPFIGVQGGWQQDRQSVDVAITAPGGSSNTTVSNKNDGFAYGIQAGYDARLSDAFVLGGEVALTGRTGSGTLTDGVDQFTLRQGRTFDITARAGYLVNPSSLLYIRGGYTNTRFDVESGVDRDGTNRGGYKVGAGYEMMFAKNVSARLEYNYSDYGSENLFDIATGVGANRANVNFNRHAVTAGVNFRF